MFTVHALQTPPDEALESQVTELVINNLTDISAVAIAPSNPLYPLYQYGVGHEVHQYLQTIGGSGEVTAELLVALDADQRLQGFALYLPVKGDDQACALTYLAVDARHRRQGIARALLGEMTRRYPHAELACVVSRVPWFRRLGFQVLGARGSHVWMNTRDQGTDGRVAVLDVAPIYRSLEVRQIHAYLLKQHGKRAMVDAEKHRDRHLDQLARQARAFVQAQG
ncbi:GNAT family N-acetyltransferase [Pseudomonas sp. dw_358]|uniref:GNAT family N-acetyltransferase n=1 Tax=Pseudomonas sp. dw_358 TaxID=2720083 RepID=UPI001BD49AF8|nr:GNAT family N-acetyltransferase [Pseudomonas sp. dw_358]